MNKYTMQRTYRCTLLDSSIVQTVKAFYQVTELDDDYTTEELVYGTLEIIRETDGH